MENLKGNPFPNKTFKLVTGAAGFISFHLIKSLISEGQNIIAIDNFDPNYSRSQKEKNLQELETFANKMDVTFEFSEQDIIHLKNDTFRNRKIDQVFHLAAKVGVRPSMQYPFDYLETNVLGTLRVLDLCKTQKISKLIFASSSSVYGNNTPAPFSEDSMTEKPISPYAASKKSCELYCQNYAHLYQIRIALLRLFTVYGPRQRPDLAIHKFLRNLELDQEITLFGDGTSSRDYTYVDDIVSGFNGAARFLDSAQPGTCEIFNLGGGNPISLIDLVRELEATTGKNAMIQWNSPQPGDVEKTYARIEKAREVLGYEPKTSIGNGLQRFYQWYNKQKGYQNSAPASQSPIHKFESSLIS